MVACSPQTCGGRVPAPPLCDPIPTWTDGHETFRCFSAGDDEDDEDG